MPRFFFDFFDGNNWSKDEVGLELASAEEACVEAFAGARSMWTELLDGRQNPCACAFDVKDQDGRSLFRFDFDELLAAVGSSPVDIRARQSPPP